MKRKLRRRASLRRRYGHYAAVPTETRWYKYKGLVPVELSRDERGLWYARAIAPNGRELVVAGNGSTSEGVQHAIELQIETKWRGFDKFTGAWV
jgi:hypothetical protein